MFGPIIIVFVCVIGLPVFFMMTGALVSALFGAALKSNAEATHEGSELIETNY